MLPPVILHLFLSPSGGPYRAPLGRGGPQRALLAWLTLLLWRWPALGATGALCVRRPGQGWLRLGSLAFGFGWLLKLSGWISAWISPWISAGFGLIWLLAFIHQDFGWIRFDFGWISAGFDLDLAWDFALSLTFTRILASSSFSEALVAL